MTKLPLGFTCTCGFVVKYPAYVYAHWRNVLDYTCEKCGKKYTIVYGKASRLRSDSRRMKGLSFSALAQKYHISIVHAFRVVKGTRWKHLA